MTTRYAELLGAARETSQILWSDLAGAVGRHQSAFTRVMGGTRLPFKWTDTVEIARNLGVKAHDLLVSSVPHNGIEAAVFEDWTIQQISTLVEIVEAIPGLGAKKLSRLRKALKEIIGKRECKPRTGRGK